MIELDIHKALNGTNGIINLHVEFYVAKGSFLTLYGASGVGKTSILKVIAGLVHPDGGKITCGEQVWYDHDKKIMVSPQKRNIGFVFQDYALMPHMTVRQNLEFALRSGSDSNMVDELIDIMELGELRYQKPSRLSGGQQQRLALARAVVSTPGLLLLDEPLSALDISMRSKLLTYLRLVHDRNELTTIMVSHDPEEILKLSDTLVEVRDGSTSRPVAVVDYFGGGQTSAKFSFTGQVLDIQSEDVIYVVTVKVGQEKVRVVADRLEVENMHIGDKVMVASKAFNPVIKKLG